jgi:hypothetical protein
VTQTRKHDKTANRFKDFLEHTVSGVEAVGCDELPNFAEIGESLWVKDKSTYEWRRSSLLRRRRSNASSPSIRCNTAPLDIIIAAIQHVACAS